ncbi:hypothetical protein, partial [Terrabacter sp. RAF57]|uniref:hypothetical protein n=1 Tax=Terrabacter sp. RAF57 TaxID=3233063 RepID=UPI003F9A12D0
MNRGLLTLWLTPDLWRQRPPLEGCTQAAAGRMYTMPAAHPKEFRDDVIAVARRGEAPLGQ